MNQLLSRITSLGKIGWKSLGFAQKTENILSDGFDISTTIEIGEEELMKIFSNRLTPNSKPFFIISNQEINTTKRKFVGDDVEICHESDWFALIRPNDSSHIVIPSENRWISFNTKKQSVERAVLEGMVWGLGGGTFQLDKNYGKQLIHTHVSIQTMQTILEQALS